MDQDEQHLRLLSIFHYVYGGLIGGLGALVGLLYFAMGLWMATALPTSGGRGQPPPPEFGIFFATIGAVVAIVSLAIAGCVIVAGRFLARKTHWMFCLVIAGLICLNAPLGTVLELFRQGVPGRIVQPDEGASYRDEPRPGDYRFRSR